MNVVLLLLAQVFTGPALSVQTAPESATVSAMPGAIIVYHKHSSTAWILAPESEPGVSSTSPLAILASTIHLIRSPVAVPVAEVPPTASQCAAHSDLIGNCSVTCPPPKRAACRHEPLSCTCIEQEGS